MLRFTLFLACLLGIFTQARADDLTFEQKRLLSQTLTQITIEQPDSISFCENGKLYLKPERILASFSGLFLVSGYSSIFLPMVVSNSNGCYIPLNDIDKMNLLAAASIDLWIIWICECGSWNGSSDEHCYFCGKRR